MEEETGLLKTMKLRDLSASETEIMKILWEVDEDICLAELSERIHEAYGKEHKKTTLGTFIQRLIEKKYITSYKVGRQSFVHVEVTEEDYKEILSEDQINRWHHGSISDFVLCFSKSTEGISPEEAERIHAILNGLDD